MLFSIKLPTTYHYVRYFEYLSLVMRNNQDSPIYSRLAVSSDEVIWVDVRSKPRSKLKKKASAKIWLDILQILLLHSNTYEFIYLM